MFETLAEHDLRVVKGLTPEIAQMVVENSLQPAVLASAPRDANERFIDQRTAMDWYESVADRRFYSLGRASQLAGIIWFTPTRRGDEAFTLAIRMYEPFVGKGLGTLFARIAHDDLARDYSGGTWADIHVDNIASQRLAYKVGYRLDETSVDAGSQRIQMIRPATNQD